MRPQRLIHPPPLSLRGLMSVGPGGEGGREEIGSLSWSDALLLTGPSPADSNTVGDQSAGSLYHRTVFLYHRTASLTARCGCPYLPRSGSVPGVRPPGDIMRVTLSGTVPL